MTTAIETIDALGEEEICAAVGVGHHSIRGARTTGKFSAHWFDVIEQMCLEKGMNCPRNLFTFKSPSNAPDSKSGQGSKVSCRDVKRGNASTEIQERPSEKTGKAA